MKIIAIIPARMSSSRFPGKPLADICGRAMLGRVYDRTCESQLVEKTYIATCDTVIKEYADLIGAPCIMTADTHERCSDRTAEAMLKIEADLGSQIETVVMVQGDEPMISGEMVDDAIQALQEDPALHVVNLMSRIETVAEFDDPNEVKVVVDKQNNAMYFSREAVPSRKKGVTTVPMYKQVCVIPFRRQSLIEFNKMEPTVFEVIESIDMLRYLENGIPVKMVRTEEVTFSVDTPADLERVKQVINSNLVCE